MGKFCVVNALEQETIIVKEGTGSVFITVKSIPPGQQYVMSVDLEATYREILLVLDPGKLQAIFSTDDCHECAKVRITGYNTSELIYQKILKSSRDVSGLAIDGTLSNAWNKIRRGKERGKKHPTPTPQQATTSQSAVVPQPAAAAQLVIVSQAAIVPQQAAASQLVIVSQPAVVPNWWKRHKWWKRPPKEATPQLAVAAPDGGSAPIGSSVPDIGSAKPAEASQPVEESLTNGATQTDGAEHQATVPVI